MGMSADNSIVDDWFPKQPCAVSVGVHAHIWTAHTAPVFQALCACVYFGEGYSWFGTGLVVGL